MVDSTFDTDRDEDDYSNAPIRPDQEGRRDQQADVSDIGTVSTRKSITGAVLQNHLENFLR